jgi:hypothetical protein
MLTIRPLSILMSLLSILLLTDWPPLGSFITIPSGLRHVCLVVFFSFLLAISRDKLSTITNLSLFWLVCFYSILAVVNAQNGIGAYILGFLFTFIFYFIFLCGYCTSVSRQTLNRFFRYFVTFILIASIPSFIIGLYQGTNLKWLPGIFRELGAWALCMNLAIIGSLMLYAINKRRVYLVIASFLLVCIGMTLLKKSIFESVFIVTAAILFLTDLSNIKKIFLIIGFFLVTIVFGVLFSAQVIENITINTEYLDRVGNEGHVRIGMYLASFNIANDFYPFGSGFGSFGSLASISGGYSELYYTYGVDNIGSNSPAAVAEGAHTLLDTFWPHIVAELGYIGALLYLSLYLFPCYQALKFCRHFRFNRPYAFYVCCSLLVICMDGIALYTPEVPLFIFLGPGIVGIILRLMRDSRSNYFNVRDQLVPNTNVN